MLGGQDSDRNKNFHSHPKARVGESVFVAGAKKTVRKYIIFIAKGQWIVVVATITSGLLGPTSLLSI